MKYVTIFTKLTSGSPNDVSNHTVLFAGPHQIPQICDNRGKDLLVRVAQALLDKSFSMDLTKQTLCTSPQSYTCKQRSGLCSGQVQNMHQQVVKDFTEEAKAQVVEKNSNPIYSHQIYFVFLFECNQTTTSDRQLLENKICCS